MFSRYERGAAFELRFSDDAWTDRAYSDRFTPMEMKTPLIEAIISSSWTFAPS